MARRRRPQATRMNFERYIARGESYVLPDSSTVLSTPYVVVRNSRYGYFFKNLDFDGANRLKEMLMTFQDLLSGLYILEQKKEAQLLSAIGRYFDKRAEQGQDTKFSALLNVALQHQEYSQAFTMIQAYREGRYNVDEAKLNDEGNGTYSLDDKTNMENITRKWYKLGNAAMKTALARGLASYDSKNSTTAGRRKITSFNKDSHGNYIGGTNPLEMTIGDLLDRAEVEYIENAKTIMTDQLLDKTSEMWNAIRDKVGNKISLNSTIGSLKDLMPEEGLKVTTRGKKGKGTKTIKNFENLTVSQVARELIPRVLELVGFGAEVYVGRGTSTGSVKNSKGQNIKGDAIMVYDVSEDVIVEIDLKKIFDEMGKSFNNLSANELQNTVKEYLDKQANRWAIWYSSKDLNVYSTYQRATIAEEASFATRLDDLKRMASVTPEGFDKSVVDLIFAITNMAKGGLLDSAEEREKIRGGIAGLCFTWMFDNVAESFADFAKAEVQGKQLHAYFSGGKYYMYSEILFAMLQRLKRDTDKAEAFARKYLQVSFSLYSPETNELGEKEETSIYGEVTKEGDYQGIPKWDEVRKRTLENNKMTIRMQIAALQKLIFGILPLNSDTEIDV